MKKIIFLLIFVSYFAFNESSNAKGFINIGNDLKNYKVKTIDKEIRIPDDVYIFNKNSEKLYLEEFEGKTLIISFWATWCAHCMHSIPDLDVLKKDFRKLPLEILPISEDFQGLSIIEKFYKDNEIRYLKIYHDYKNQLFKAMDVVGIPTNFIVDSEGYVRVLIEGAVNWYDEELRELILEYIDGDYPMPKNSFKDKSLNKQVKVPINKAKDSKDSNKNSENVDKAENTNTNEQAGQDNNKNSNINEDKRENK